ncbi:hypothetical protein B0A54_09749 [Friedmanniomyces endolithicus]|uniref:DNA polymerase delta subunit 4 n=1 Tax=Friedmanniomyces endolithicus TaxID=329885 RepID=A0A4U0UPQ7_9PEZI|nr:hypothetical protein B0A54_09749 [Friedmanniomyces endolithicus]
MPPKRKSSGPRAVPTRTPSNPQSTLSFHGKQNKVTKPGVAPVTKQLKKDPALLEEIARTEIKTDSTPEPKESTTASAAITQRSDEEAQNLAAPSPHPAADPLDTLGGRAQTSDVGAAGGKTGAGWLADEEAQARSVTETQIKQYWRQKEAMRLAPRVHQEGMTVYEKVLREWDMSGQFGVSLHPTCVADLDDRSGIARLKRWKRANALGLKPPVEVLAVLLRETEGGNGKAQRAYVDELMSSRFVET